jgi:hypothetical protein
VAKLVFGSFRQSCQKISLFWCRKRLPKNNLFTTASGMVRSQSRSQGLAPALISLSLSLCLTHDHTRHASQPAAHGPLRPSMPTARAHRCLSPATLCPPPLAPLHRPSRPIPVYLHLKAARAGTVPYRGGRGHRHSVAPPPPIGAQVDCKGQRWNPLHPPPRSRRPSPRSPWL